MQSKGAIRLVAILLAIACLWQLSFTLVTNMQEKKADKYADSVAAASGLPIVATAVDENVFNQLDGKIDNLISMKLQKRPV